MTNAKMTLKEAVQKWVGEFNAIPQDLITKAYPNFSDEVELLSTIRECESCEGNDFKKNEDEELCCSHCESTDISMKYDFPMWGWMWTFKSGLDADWALENLDKMEECGIWVFRSDELGVFFGINGAGYDFYESHWTPLYKARGLQWHSNN
ncbi:hypothetical protein JR311_19780 (plasmid) [Bacillus velezensis]|uniref:hypothetical protein n=1 Tax=Bacillus velezensis TaxID=492670 RepID=UPI0019583348|nr:hypothetical protein [Bacillus velezensis]QRV11451.1 hypothetical protein JR311_19780 [Bacillus velezensis]